MNILRIFSAHVDMNSHTLMETKIVWPKVGLGEAYEEGMAATRPAENES